MRAVFFGQTTGDNDLRCCGADVWQHLQSDGCTTGDLNAMGYYRDACVPVDAVFVLCGKLDTFRAGSDPWAPLPGTPPFRRIH